LRVIVCPPAVFWLKETANTGVPPRGEEFSWNLEDKKNGFARLDQNKYYANAPVFGTSAPVAARVSVPAR